MSITESTIALIDSLKSTTGAFGPQVQEVNIRLLLNCSCISSSMISLDTRQRRTKSMARD